MQAIAIDTATQSWEAAAGYPDGTMRKVLRLNEEGNPQTLLLKLPPGFAMDDHSHVNLEQHYVLEGEYEVKGERHGAGCYVLIPEHTDHGPFRSRDGALILVFWES